MADKVGIVRVGCLLLGIATIGLAVLGASVIRLVHAAERAGMLTGEQADMVVILSGGLSAGVLLAILVVIVEMIRRASHGR